MIPNKKEYTHFDILGEQFALPLLDVGNKTKEHILMEATVLFAKNGYVAVSMRELADGIGIKPASLYNHFASKEALWDAVIDHSAHLYLLYFQELGKALEKVNNFPEMLEVMFLELRMMRNLFTCYAFGLIHTEQFRDDRAAEVFNGTFLEYSINFIKNWFDLAIEKGWAKVFDTRTTATFFMNSVLMGLNIKVQETLGRPLPYDLNEMFADLQKLIGELAAPGLPPANQIK